MIASNSLATMAVHTPLTPMKSGRTVTVTTWNKSNLEKEIVAEIRPLLRAVKKADAKIFTPARR